MAVLPYYNSANNDYLNTGQLWTGDSTFFCYVKIADVAQEDSFNRIIANRSGGTLQGFDVYFNGVLSTAKRAIGVGVKDNAAAAQTDLSTNTYGRNDLLFIAVTFETSTKLIKGYIIKDAVVDTGINYVYAGSFNFNNAASILLLKTPTVNPSGTTGWLYNVGIANAVLSQAQIESIYAQCLINEIPALSGVTFTLNRRALAATPYLDEGDGLGALTVQYTSTLGTIDSESEISLEDDSQLAVIANSEGELFISGETQLFSITSVITATAEIKQTLTGTAEIEQTLEAESEITQTLVL